MLPLLFLPALIVNASSAVIPDAMEVHPGFFVLKTAPGPATYAALKKAGITHVVNLRRDGEHGFDSDRESAEVTATGAAYVRLAIGKAPSKDDLDLFRMILGDLPSSAQVLVHCGDGNRAAGALCAWLVLDKGLKLEDAMTLSKQAGLALPETEGAVRKYLGTKMKS